ncbi:hypothetical protein MIZ03_0859 [Rhodoferax lithotrophicus]|uniref:CENP-V/GFA domain-containing protein n=1 Tax=Rhodoferax lithotrophicus TaxID=2798804 RepID=A0ABM7MIA5_9BURK|nr:GFA family protein [Rhodoferax sp. MIZ03]BCO25980.1 hypothetical protein MIZ03_0859 [Rhodoferax sp. MIZ03]
MPTSFAHGSCLCGAVRFEAGLPPKWVAHCHCTRCQRAHGAAFVTWVGVDAVDTVVSDTRSALTWYTTSEGASRGFCHTCGSPMFFKSPRWPGELHIARALFLEPVDLMPQSHVHFDTRVNWVCLGDSLPVEVDAV